MCFAYRWHCVSDGNPEESGLLWGEDRNMDKTEAQVLQSGLCQDQAVLWAWMQACLAVVCVLLAGITYKV